MLKESVNGNQEHLPISSLPKTALQAIYHAVTGKTENLTRALTGNVIIKDFDIDRLYGMLNDQLGLHEKVIEPTVTVVVKQARGKAITYSSWSRYKSLFVDNHEVTSEIILKMEFVLQLPQAPSPQRCIVNINLDSSLPMISNHKESSDRSEAFGLLFFMKKDWRTVVVSIDFVDFLVAKSFSNIIEEWFLSLNRCPQSKLNDFLLNQIAIIQSVMGQVGRVGFAFFLGALIIFNDPSDISLVSISLATAFGLLLWSLVVILERGISRKIFKRLSANIIPSVILLTDADHKSYSKVTSDLNQPIGTVVTTVTAFLFGITANVLSSYLYTYLTSV